VPIEDGGTGIQPTHLVPVHEIPVTARGVTEKRTGDVKVWRGGVVMIAWGGESRSSGEVEKTGVMTF